MRIKEQAMFSAEHDSNLLTQEDDPSFSSQQDLPTQFYYCG